MISVGGVFFFLLFITCSGVCSFCCNFSERQILWSLCSVDFHTLTLQLPIQTPHSVAPELQVFVSSLKISAKRAHPRDLNLHISTNLSFSFSLTF